MPVMDYDYVVIGAGICGLSAAAALSLHGRVAVVEQEDSPCYHSSGRSAAIFARHYGSDAIRALTMASAPLFDRAERDGLFAALSEKARGILFVAPPGRTLPDDTGTGQRLISAARASAIAPLVPTDRIAYGLWDDSGRDIDVHAMQLGYIRQLRDHGGIVLTGRAVAAARRRGDRWEIQAGSDLICARHVVNAAGGWADAVASLFGAASIGLTPRKRSAVLIDPPSVAAGARPVPDWPLVFDVDQTLYFKPEAGKLMLSPMDATPVDPHDCWADEMDIAIAVDRYERWTGHQVTRVSHSWAGLRSFAPDDDPVIGADPAVPGFFWLAALGGSGVKTAPASGALTCALVTGTDLPDGISPDLAARLSPARFAQP